MKKWLLIVCLFLWGCDDKEVAFVETIENEVQIEEEVVEEIIINDDLVNELLKLTNKEMRIIDIEVLHEKMSQALLSKVDMSQSLDTQSDIIKAVVLEEVLTWRQDQVDKIIIQEQVDLSSEEKNMLIEKTIYNEMYQLMLEYEKIFLKNYNQ